MFCSLVREFAMKRTVLFAISRKLLFHLTHARNIHLASGLNVLRRAEMLGSS
jgi:hypothetical protein